MNWFSWFFLIEILLIGNDYSLGDETNGISIEMFERFYDGDGHLGNESMLDDSIGCTKSTIDFKHIIIKKNNPIVFV
jgi:hypothetical protein